MCEGGPYVRVRFLTRDGFAKQREGWMVIDGHEGARMDNWRIFSTSEFVGANLDTTKVCHPRRAYPIFVRISVSD